MNKKTLENNEIIYFNKTFFENLSNIVEDKMILKSFFSRIKIYGVENNEVLIKTDLKGDSLNFLRRDYKEKITKALNETFDKKMTFRFEFFESEPNKINIEKKENIYSNEFYQAKAKINLNENINSQFKKDFSFDNYVESDFNRQVIAIGKNIAEGGFLYNPVFIFSKSGLGKTHLLNAIGLELEKKNVEVIYLNAIDFVTDATIILQDNKQEKIKEWYQKYYSADVLMFDDFQHYGQGNKKSTLTAINQILDYRVNKGKLTIFTSDKSPQLLNAMFDQRLITRLVAGLQIKINTPKQEDILVLLNEFLKRNKISPENWEEEAKKFIARNFHGSVRTLLGAITMLMYYKKDIETKFNSKYTFAVVQKILSEISSNKDSITPDYVVEYVAKYYKIHKKDILGKSRKKEFVIARHIAMFIIRDELKLPLIKIGEIFGNRDHSTVVNAIRKVEFQKESNDMSYSRALSAITDEIHKLI
ncbi:chromosomal replication initiator protein DnaA [Mycoplasmopsis phocirhinis]|uniref:Chromosomal replication initiator protein DnaA n=1 Tax=Mycoplasmopsis phocirhinis TaxID=142650 RepID=A0A4P6ML60_9BACT|nr:chromosomal replication initiator protein DnaA [Mycoplasmopsis phocirhinis]QBF34325.1 chromosomal replication initiator protein DnaA [Mycoplasmopsis phocirhinis]